MGKVKNSSSRSQNEEGACKLTVINSEYEDHLTTQKVLIGSRKVILITYAKEASSKVGAVAAMEEDKELTRYSHLELSYHHFWTLSEWVTIMI